MSYVRSGASGGGVKCRLLLYYPDGHAVLEERERSDEACGAATDLHMRMGD